MKTKSRVTLVLLLLLLVCGGAVWAARTRFDAALPTPTTAAARQSAPTPGSLAWYAQQSSAVGETSFSLILSPGTLRASDLGQAVSRYGLAVGELLAQESVRYDPPDAIYTWYKFRLTETLTNRPFIPCADCSFTPTPPAGLLPLQSGEILVPLLGGSALIENVVVETNIEDFNGLVMGQRYLLFLNLDSNQTGDIPIGPQGILHVNGDNTFTPVMMLAPGETEPIINGLATQYGNSLTQLRAALNPPQPTPTPTGCDPNQRLACFDNGGSWNNSTCHCTMPVDPCLRKPWLCP